MAHIHEVETVFQGAIVRAESAWAVDPGGSGIKLYTCEMSPSVKMEREAKQYKGFLAPTTMTEGKEWSEWEMTGDASAVEMPLFVRSIVSNAQSDPLSFTIEHGGIKASGCTVTGWNVEGNTTAITISANMSGKKAVKTALVPAGNVPNDTALFDPASVQISLGSTVLPKAFNWSIDVSSLWELVYFIGDYEPQNVAHIPMDGNFSITVAADDMALNFIEERDQIPLEITGSTKGTSPKTFSISAIVALEEPESFSDEGGVYAIGLKGKIMNGDGTAIKVVYS